MPPTPATLDDFMALNEQLAALARAGVPLDVGWTTGTDGPEKSLERINAAVARQVSRGATVDQAIERDSALPPAYRCLVEVGLRGRDLDAALDGARRLAATNDASRYNLRAAFFYPLIVVALAYLGLIGVCRWLVPVLQDAYAEMRVPAQRGLLILQELREAMPYWIYVPPVALALGIVAWLAMRSRRISASDHQPGAWARLTGRTSALAHEQLANFSDSLAALLDAQTPLREAVSLAAGAVGDPALNQSVQAIADDVNGDGRASQEQAIAENSHLGRDLPPFLRWAILQSEPTVERSHALRLAASLYRDAAARTSSRLRLLAPSLACLVIGGSVVLLYSLAVFVPVIDLLAGLGAPPR